MLTRDLLGTILLINIQLVLGVAGLIEFSQTFGGTDGEITSIQDINIEACRSECENRVRCRSAVYYRLMHFCVLTSLLRDEQQVVPEIGIVLLSGFHPGIQPSIDCDGTTCSFTDTCTSAQPGNKVCKLTECEQPMADHAEFLGNRFSVGSKQVDICGYRDVHVTCDQSGQWKPSESLVVRDCNGVCGTSGIYTVSGLQVYCDMDTDEGHWLVFQRRQDGSETFERNWSDYRDGFGSLDGEFWLGLDPLHHILSNGDYELRIDLEDWDGNKKFARYSSFSISDESDNYRLVVSGYSGDESGDSFSYMNGNMFSTIDVDNDISPGSCAANHRGGWWYVSCHACNLNGLYHHDGYTAVYAKTMVWSSWHGHYYSLKRTELKIRRN